MAKETNNVSLGNGDLYLNGVDVGHLKGTVTLTYTRNTVDFKPANMTGPVKKFVVGEEVMLQASMAELKVANWRLAMGHTAEVGSDAHFSSAFSYDPASFADLSTAGSSYDYIKFGGHKTVQEVPLEFIHTRESGKKIVVVFYKASPNGEFNIPFDEENVILYDIAWTCLADEDRTAGDQMGMIAEEVSQA